MTFGLSSSSSLLEEEEEEALTTKSETFSLLEEEEEDEIFDFKALLPLTKEENCVVDDANIILFVYFFSLSSLSCVSIGKTSTTDDTSTRSVRVLTSNAFLKSDAN